MLAFQNMSGDLEQAGRARAWCALVITISYYLSREYDAAVEAAKRRARAYPDHSNQYRWLAAALG